jgi:hypothetical protein
MTITEKKAQATLNKVFKFPEDPDRCSVVITKTEYDLFPNL